MLFFFFVFFVPILRVWCVSRIKIFRIIFFINPVTFLEDAVRIDSLMVSLELMM